ncbi:MAG TPA: rhomboid family intramembrane serine protease [Flavobacteriales bacterium]|nr:rhomboid family intramembrane serine protease [Flavobacteriales bacterium]HQV73918.1 rhomboid family intramembrane serine protease [Flavobacteriales bacterium]
MGPLDDLKMQWRMGGMLMRLILINVAVFVGLVLVYLVLLPLGGSGAGAQALRDLYVVQWLRSTADLGTLATRPWTLFTYMFTHTGLGHIFWNMILLWFGGRLFQDLLGGKRLLGHYLLGGLTGVVLFIVVQNLMPGFHGGGAAPGILGASAGALSVFIGIAAYRPDMLVNLILIGPVKLMYVAGVFLLLDLIGIGSGDGVAHEAHIGGALYGFVAARQLTKGNDWSLRFVEFWETLFRAFTSKKKSKLRVEKPYVKSTVERERKVDAEQQNKQARVDAILDKISKSGYDSLTKVEKDFLFKAGSS